MRKLAMLLTMLALPALADDIIDCVPGTGQHFNGAEMICDQRITPPVALDRPAPCSPATRPGTLCVWTGLEALFVPAVPNFAGAMPIPPCDAGLIGVPYTTPDLPWLLQWKCVEPPVTCPTHTSLSTNAFFNLAWCMPDANFH